MSSALIEAFAKLPKLVSHLHLPVQAGSDRILSAMKRNYTALQYKSAIRKLRRHVAEERQAIAEGDAATSTFLLADFHVCLAECSGNRLLTDVMRDLTARTTLVALLYQSSHDASQSCHDHAAIVEALAKGDTKKAEQLMLAHIGSVQGALHESSATGDGDELSRLRASLTPL